MTELVFITEDSGIDAPLNGMIDRKDQNEMLHQTKVPVLFILGRKDNYIPVEVAEKMVANHPEAEVVWLDTPDTWGSSKSPKSLHAIVEFRYYVQHFGMLRHEE